MSPTIRIIKSQSTPEILNEIESWDKEQLCSAREKIVDLVRLTKENVKNNGPSYKSEAFLRICGTQIAAIQVKLGKMKRAQGRNWERCFIDKAREILSPEQYRSISDEVERVFRTL